jgi:hypothetical protein
MAAPTLVQTKVSTATSATTSGSVTFDSTPASGAFIVVFVYSSVNYSGLSISDAGGNTYTLRQGDGYADMWGRIYTAPATNNPGAITVNQSSGLLTIVACEVNGYLASGPIEKQDRVWDTISSAKSPWSPLNFTTTTNAEQLFLGCIGLNVTSGTVDWMPGTGWTSVSVNNTTTGQIGHALISKAVTSTGTYDPEWTAATASSRNSLTAGLSIIAGSDGLPAGNIDLAGAATAGAAGSAALTVQRNIAAAAVAGALGSGALSVQRALTGAAIAQAVGSAALAVFSQVWRIPTNAANGSAVHALIFTGVAPNYTVLAQGNATVAGGYVDVPGSGSAGTKAFAFVHNYNDNTATVSIRGGPAIATLTSI